MSEAEVINYMRQICEGVKHMHERNIIHLGKLKYMNIKSRKLLYSDLLLTNVLPCVQTLSQRM